MSPEDLGSDGGLLVGVKTSCASPKGKICLTISFRVSDYAVNILLMNRQAIRPGAFVAVWGEQRQECSV